MSTNPPIYSPPIPLPERLTREPLVDPKDGTIRSWAWKQFFQKLNQPTKIPTLTTGTHPDRLKIDPSNVVSGSIFAETDRGLQYIAQNGKWTYYAGIYQVAQQNIPSDLQPSDVGTLIHVEDYAHVLQWAANPQVASGFSFVWGPGDPRSGFIAQFVSGPDDPTGWQVCDGSLGIGQLQADGSVIAVDVPSVDAQHFFRQ